MPEHKHADHQPYLRLAGMTLLSLISMYTLMYAMVNSFANVFNSINQVYMAGLMAAPMVLIEIVPMRSMYPDQRLNLWIAAGSVLALVLFFVAIWQQAAVTDRQFLRSMIPHHAGAILMCEEAPIQDPTIKDHCKGIISSQQSEIAQMKAMLNRQSSLRTGHLIYPGQFVWRSGELTGGQRPSFHDAVDGGDDNQR